MRASENRRDHGFHFAMDRAKRNTSRTNIGVDVCVAPTNNNHVSAMKLETCVKTKDVVYLTGIGS